MVEQKINIENKEKSYHTLSKQLEALIKDEPDITANLANASALLNQFLDKINWVGFYIWRETELVLGPFQGLPACIRIPANEDRKSTRLNSSHVAISYAVFCLKKKTEYTT